MMAIESEGSISASVSSSKSLEKQLEKQFAYLLIEVVLSVFVV